MSLLTRPLSKLLTSTTRLTRRSYSTKKTSDGQEPQKIPSFNLKDLGATPTIRAIVYLSFGVIATVETYTYGMWGWSWWKNRKAGEGKGE